MAQVRVHDSDEIIDHAETIRTFCQAKGLDFEVWPMDKLAAGEADNPHAILEAFAAQVDVLKARGGYQTADVIMITPETPNLDVLLAKFDKEHIHTEDEVRFVVDGRGVFTIHAEDETVFDVEVHPGDLLVVPEGTKHWFTLCDDRKITCIRLFTSTDGWVAHYTPDA